MTLFKTNLPPEDDVLAHYWWYFHLVGFELNPQESTKNDPVYKTDQIRNFDLFFWLWATTTVMLNLRSILDHLKSTHKFIGFQTMPSLLACDEIPKSFYCRTAVGKVKNWVRDWETLKKNFKIPTMPQVPISEQSDKKWHVIKIKIWMSPKCLNLLYMRWDGNLLFSPLCPLIPLRSIFQ